MTYSTHLPTVIALHCTGATGRQWRGLEAALDGRAHLVAPDLSTTSQDGPQATLQVESGAITDILDEAPEPVHIVGHSYGGALALRVTLQRPKKVASLTLYEPSCFQLLDELGEPGDAAMSEIGVVAGAVADLVARGHGEAAVRVHFDVQAEASEAGIRALAMPQTSPSAWRGCWLARPLEQGDQHITNDQVNISSL